MENKSDIFILKKLINTLRDMRAYTIKSDDLGEEQLYYLQEGYREGLCAAAMTIADELDAILQSDTECPEEFPEHLMSDLEEKWWHTHNDDKGDIGSSHRW